MNPQGSLYNAVIYDRRPHRVFHNPNIISSVRVKLYNLVHKITKLYMFSCNGTTVKYLPKTGLTHTGYIYNKGILEILSYTQLCCDYKYAMDVISESNNLRSVRD